MYDTLALEEIIQKISKILEVHRHIAFQVALLHLEYQKPNNGKWEGNT